MFKCVYLINFFVCCQLMLFFVSSNGQGSSIKSINESLNIATINHINLFKKNQSIEIYLESSQIGKKLNELFMYKF